MDNITEWKEKAMKRTVFFTILVSILVHSLGVSTASAQVLTGILDKLDKLEAQLNTLKSTQNQEIGELKNQITQISTVKGDSKFEDTLTNLRSEMNRLAGDVEQVKSEEVHRMSKMEDMNHLVTDLRGMIEEFRSHSDMKADPPDNNRVVLAEKPLVQSPVAMPPVVLNRKPGQIIPGLMLAGSIRLRSETKDDFNFDNSLQDYFLTQFRLSLKWAPTEWFTAFVEGQDARVLGEEKGVAPGINRSAVPNIFADSFDLHQGYIDLKFPAGKVPVRVRGGRQKFNLSAKRLVSSLEWVNTARVWDGLRVTIGKGKRRTLDMIASRLVPVDPNGANFHSRTKSRMFNSYFHALYFTDWLSLSGIKAEGYWMMRYEGGVDDAVQTVGTHLTTKGRAWDADLELAGQFGDYGGLDHRAFAAHAGVGYTFRTLNNSRIGFGYNFGSGDGDPTDAKHTTFDNQYPLNHAYYGFMDFFALQNMHNAEAIFNTKLWNAFGLRLAYQAFWLAKEDSDAWYNAGAGAVRKATGEVNSYVGSEVDITVKYGLKNVALEAGYSHFFTGSYIQDTGPKNDADFLYLTTKTSF